MALLTTATYSTQAEFNSVAKNDWSTLTAANWNKAALYAEDIVDSYVQIQKSFHYSDQRKFPTELFEGSCGLNGDVPCDITKAHILITENELLKSQAGKDSDYSGIDDNSGVTSEEWSSSSYKNSTGGKLGNAKLYQDYNFVNIGIPALALRILKKYQHGTLTYKI